MRPASIWLFLALVLVPVLHAELLPWVRGAAQARFLATAGAAAAFLLACVLSGSYFATEGAPIIAQLPLDQRVTRCTSPSTRSTVPCCRC